MLRNYWVKFWTNSIKHFRNNRPVRLPTLRFSYTLFLTVAILRFFKKGINFVITVAFCNDTAYTRVFWFDNWLVWRYSSWSAHENTWMLRTSCTASWKTNNHSSSGTLQTEHHFIYLYIFCILNNITIECIKRKKLTSIRWFGVSIYMHNSYFLEVETGSYSVLFNTN